MKIIEETLGGTMSFENYSLVKEGELPFRVRKDVIKHLSIGLYSNFARAIKELVKYPTSLLILFSYIVFFISIYDFFISILSGGPTARFRRE